MSKPKFEVKDMNNIHEIKAKYQEAVSSNKALEKIIEIEKTKNEEFRLNCLDALAELDIVGILHGAGSKQRAKEKLTEAMIKRYGVNWNIR